MIWTEYVDEFIAQIKEALPPDHEMQQHEIFPGIKWEKCPIFIVDDDTTDQRLLMNFEKMRRWKKTKYKVPAMRVFKDDAEVAAMIERDHRAECAKYNDDGSLKVNACEARKIIDEPSVWEAILLLADNLFRSGSLSAAKAERILVDSFNGELPNAFKQCFMASIDLRDECRGWPGVSR